MGDIFHKSAGAVNDEDEKGQTTDFLLIKKRIGVNSL